MSSMGIRVKNGMFERGTVKRASMVPPRDISARAGCERNAEDDFLAGEIVRPRENMTFFTLHVIPRQTVIYAKSVQNMLHYGRKNG